MRAKFMKGAAVKLPSEVKNPVVAKVAPVESESPVTIGECEAGAGIEPYPWVVVL